MQLSRRFLVFFSLLLQVGNLCGEVSARALTGTIPDVQKKGVGQCQLTTMLRVELFGKTNSVERRCTTRLYASKQRWLSLVTEEDVWTVKRFRRFTHGEQVFGPQFRVRDLIAGWSCVTNHFTMPFTLDQLKSASSYANAFRRIGSEMCYQQDSGRWMCAETMPITYRFYTEVSNRDSVAYIVSPGNDQWRIDQMTRGKVSGQQKLFWTPVSSSWSAWQFPLPKGILDEKNRVCMSVAKDVNGGWPIGGVRNIACEYLTSVDGKMFQRTKFRAYSLPGGQFVYTREDHGQQERVYKYTVSEIDSSKIERRNLPIIRMWRRGEEEYSALAEFQPGKFLLGTFVHDPLRNPKELPTRISIICPSARPILSTFSSSLTDLAILANVPCMFHPGFEEMFRIPFVDAEVK